MFAMAETLIASDFIDSELHLFSTSTYPESLYSFAALLSHLFVYVRQTYPSTGSKRPWKKRSFAGS